jgi:hypothetical protein
MKGIKAVVQVYHRAGFNANVALMDGEFTKLRGALADIGIALNETAVPEQLSLDKMLTLTGIASFSLVNMFRPMKSMTIQ